MPTASCLDIIDRALSETRAHLGMDVAYISEFDGNLAIFKKVDAPGLERLIKPGDFRSLDDVYCRHILAGRLPELITDTSRHPLALELPITEATPIGAHVSVPINNAEGEPLGMFCCLSAHPNETLTERDLGFVRILANVVGGQIAEEMGVLRRASERAERVRRAMEDGAFFSVFQPIFDFRTRRPVGLEALTRFTAQPYRPPNEWFADAEAAGLGVELELEVLSSAMAALDVIPRDIYLSINASPATILSGRLEEVLALAEPQRLLVEITEHAIVDNYDDLVSALAPLRRSGIRIAIDDAGAGYSTLQHILRLDPDRIKLDMSLTRSIDTDPARRALALAMVLFARETHATLIAEGVETEGEFAALQALGVNKGQGYFFGRPAPLADALEAIRNPQPLGA